MLQNITRALLAFAAGVFLTAPALAASPTCADIGPFVRGDADATKGIEVDFTTGTTEEIEFRVNLAVGNKVQLRVTSPDYFIFAEADVAGANPFTAGAFKSDIITDLIELADPLTLITVTIVPDGEYAEGSVTLYCEGEDDEEEEPGGEGSDTLAEMQDTIVQQSSAVATEMITDLVGASIDAAYAGNTDAANSFMGYTGTMLISEPVDGSGSTLWAGLKYHWTFGGDEQWAGGQWTGTGGINFRLDDSWVIGVFGGYEQSGMTLAALDRSFDGSGGSLGVSAAYRFDDWRLELLGYGSRLSYDLADGDTTASFGAWRYVLDGGLVGTLPVAASLDFAPTARIAVVREFHEAYSDSDAADHAARDYLAARLSAGGKLIFYPLSGGITLAAGAYADYWTTEGQANSGLTGRAEIDAAIDLTEQARLGLNASLDSIGGQQLGATLDASLKAGF
jgi:hypothetical protein